MACTQESPTPPAIPPLRTDASTAREGESPFDTGRTAFGFFPSPPELTFEAVLQHFQDLSTYADFLLLQPNIPWEDFVEGTEGQSQSREDLRNQVVLARQNGLEVVFVVDPLNGLNRREFFGLPSGWEASFANPQVRLAYTHFTRWIVGEFNPRYLGLASEINTYMDAHTEDTEHFLSLYRENYRWVKGEAPGTGVFVTFQWDDLNNLFPEASEGRRRFEVNWEQVEAFEPDLDLWAISSYPYFIFNGGSPIPEDYYTTLRERTDKPLAVAEGGYSSRPVGPIQVTPEDQVEYLEAIHDQLGDRLAFWVYILLNDLNMDVIGEEMRRQGRGEAEVETLSMFAGVGLRQADGKPKPALEVWQGFRR